MTQAPHQLDVRPILRAGGEPFTVIMDAVRGLGSGQALRLLATFEPVPLYSVLAKKGFEHAAREIGGGDWEVTFTPTAAAAASRQPRDRSGRCRQDHHDHDNKGLSGDELSQGRRGRSGAIRRWSSLG